MALGGFEPVERRRKALFPNKKNLPPQSQSTHERVAAAEFVCEKQKVPQTHPHSHLKDVSEPPPGLEFLKALWH